MSLPPRGELFDSGGGSRWGARALPPGRRRLLAAVAVAVLLGGSVLWFRNWSAERELARRVDLSASLTVYSYSTAPPGGAVGYFVVVRNDGPRPVSVTAVDGATERLRMTMRFDGDRSLDPGTEHAIPLSVRLTCAGGHAEAAAETLSVDIRLRREDGGSASRRFDLRPAGPLLDAASRTCAVRPGLRDHELSGPIHRTEADGAGPGE